VSEIKDSRLLRAAELACLCILHLEMRVGEKLITLLLKTIDSLYTKANAKLLLDKILRNFNEILAGAYVMALDQNGDEEEVNLLPVDSDGHPIDFKFELLTTNDDVSSVVSHNFSIKIILPVKIIPQK
jgi:hypothetical protein